MDAIFLSASASLDLFFEFLRTSGIIETCIRDCQRKRLCREYLLPAWVDRDRRGIQRELRSALPGEEGFNGYCGSGHFASRCLTMCDPSSEDRCNFCVTSALAQNNRGDGATYCLPH